MPHHPEHRHDPQPAPATHDGAIDALEVERELLEFIRTRIEAVRTSGIHIDSDTQLFEAGLIDSLHILALIGFVEHRLGQRLDDEEIVMPHFRSVRSIIDAFFS